MILADSTKIVVENDKQAMSSDIMVFLQNKKRCKFNIRSVLHNFVKVPLCRVIWLLFTHIPRRLLRNRYYFNASKA